MSLHDIKSMVVPLALDKPRTIKFDLNAFAELEEKYGSMEKAFSAMQSGSIKAARTLLWAGLLHEDESLTERKVGGLVTLENLSTVMDSITVALTEAIPQEEGAIQESTPADPT